MAMHTNRTENACVGKGRRKKSNRALVGYTGEPMNRLPETSVHPDPLTNPLYLNESCTDRKSNQNGHRNSNRNSSIKSAIITMAHNIRNFMYKNVLLQREEGGRQ